MHLAQDLFEENGRPLNEPFGLPEAPIDQELILPPDLGTQRERKRSVADIPGALRWHIVPELLEAGGVTRQISFDQDNVAETGDRYVEYLASMLADGGIALVDSAIPPGTNVQIRRFWRIGEAISARIACVIADPDGA